MSRYDLEWTDEKLQQTKETIWRYIDTLADSSVNHTKQQLSRDDRAILGRVIDYGQRDSMVDDALFEVDWVIDCIVARIANDGVSEMHREELLRLVRLRLGALALDIECDTSDLRWLQALDAVVSMPHDDRAARLIG